MTALVHWIAELVAFLVLVFLLYKYVWPMLKRSAEQKQDEVQRQVEESDRAASDLDEARRRYEQAVADASAEAARIRDDARADAERIREELRAQAEREVERIKQRGQEELAAERDQVVRSLRAEIAKLSLETAQRKVTESLHEEGARTASVDRFLDELGGLGNGSEGVSAPSGASSASPIGGTN